MTDKKTARRVLVIDDNPSIHEDFSKILDVDKTDDELARAEAAFLGENCEVELVVHFQLDHAFQGAEGLDLVKVAIEKGKPYDLAFVDMRMPPGWDGVETIERLWAEDPDLQVVICTAYSDHTWVEIAKKLGLNDRLLILKKPFDNAEVSQLAVALTAKRHKERENGLEYSRLIAAAEDCTCGVNN
jgi:two-component system NtrC family sensor kinase